MRIIGGEFRGRKINRPETRSVRPTKDRIRESVFSIIAAAFPCGKVLDLFAGSGAYGLEALSRGAEKAFFVENNPECAGVIEANLNILSASERADVIRSDVYSYLETREPDKTALFDMIFLDPPFNSNMIKKALIIINQYDILKHSGLIVVEHSAKEEVPVEIGNLSICKQRTYKDINVSVFLKK